jgi:hypothetical protein
MRKQPVMIARVRHAFRSRFDSGDSFLGAATWRFRGLLTTATTGIFVSRRVSVSTVTLGATVAPFVNCCCCRIGVRSLSSSSGEQLELSELLVVVLRSSRDPVAGIVVVEMYSGAGLFGIAVLSRADCLHDDGL